MRDPVMTPLGRHKVYMSVDSDGNKYVCLWADWPELTNDGKKWLEGLIYDGGGIRGGVKWGTTPLLTAGVDPAYSDAALHNVIRLFGATLIEQSTTLNTRRKLLFVLTDAEKAKIKKLEADARVAYRT